MFIVLNKFRNMESSLPSALKRYLETVTGQKLEFRPIRVSKLPLFLRERFSLYSTELWGRTWSLAMEGEAWGVASPTEYEKRWESLAQYVEAPLAYVFAALPSNTRNRLVQRGVPFIVPGNQAFLPSALVDLREHFPRLAGRGRAHFSPTAQLVVLYHLHCNSLEGLSLCEIAERIGCSAMMLSKVRDELGVAKICTVERVGRSVRLHFPQDRRFFWNSVKDRLTSPVKKVCWAQWQSSENLGLLAGISALSRFTMLADDRLPTYALAPRTLESSLDQGILVRCCDSEGATAQIEVWSYDPKILTGNEVVDPFSLYLSLRHSSDERVQQALEQVMEEQPW
jgi:hypothetical protein